MTRTLIVGALLSFAMTAHPQERAPLADSLQACTSGEADACREMREHLRAQLDDGRALPTTERLCDAAVLWLAGASGSPPQFSLLRSECARGTGDACERLASVLEGLFRGDDARLAASPDASLARETASALVELGLGE
jgi:hypothetical protein